MELFAFIDDEARSLKGMHDFILSSSSKGDFQASYTNNPDDVITWVKEGAVSAVVSDYNFEKPINGLELLQEVNKINSNIPKILFSAKVTSLEKEKDLMEELNISFIHKSNKDLLGESMLEILRSSPSPVKHSLDLSDPKTDLLISIKDVFLNNIKNSKDLGIEILIPDKKTGITERIISVSELIDEVNSLTEIGCYFLEYWVKGKIHADRIIADKKKPFWSKLINPNIL